MTKHGPGAAPAAYPARSAETKERGAKGKARGGGRTAQPPRSQLLKFGSGLKGGGERGRERTMRRVRRGWTARRREGERMRGDRGVQNKNRALRNTRGMRTCISDCNAAFPVSLPPAPAPPFAMRTAPPPLHAASPLASPFPSSAPQRLAATPPRRATPSYSGRRTRQAGLQDRHVWQIQ